MAPRRFLTVVLTALALLTVSCGRITAPESSGQPASAAPEAAPDSTPDSTSTSACGEDGKTFASDVKLARCLTERFWTREFAARGATYQPVKAFIPYNGNDGPNCGDQRSVPNNAFYCPAGHFIAFDASWMKSLYDQLGDGAVYVIIPHEFGHAVQAQTVNDFQYNVERELQADCYAGGTLSGLIKAEELRADPGDDAELLANLAAAGDPTDAWWSPDAHGTPAQRQASLTTGFQQGVVAC